MAKETITRLIDDLDGTDAAETVKFGLDGKSYTIDLSSKNAGTMRNTLARYVENASKAARSASAVQSATGLDRAERDMVREWAKQQDYEIGDRGRISDAIITEWRAAGSPRPDADTSSKRRGK